MQSESPLRYVPRMTEADSQEIEKNEGNYVALCFFQAACELWKYD